MAIRKNYLKVHALNLLFLLSLINIHECQPQRRQQQNNGNLFANSNNRNNGRNIDDGDRSPTPPTGQRNFVGGFQPSSNFGNEVVRFPDSVSRPVGRRRPQQSPFRNSRPLSNDREILNDPEQFAAAPLISNRPPIQQTRPLGNTQGQPNALQRRPAPSQQSRAFASGAQDRPANVPQQSRPRPPQQQRRPSGRGGGLSLPAIAPTTKFMRPQFDVLGVPLIFGEIAPVGNDVLPDFRQPIPSQNGAGRQPRINGNSPRGKATDGQQRRPPQNQGAQSSRSNPPIFGRPDLILKATEELRSSDVNQEAILPWGTVNAGVLPLASGVDNQNFGFFPPFNKPRTKVNFQPK